MRIKNTKEVILDVALRLFAEQGYDATTVNQIAEKVGIKAPSLYNHYKSKEDIFRALIDASIKGYEENMNKLHADYSNPRVRKQLVEMTIDEQVDEAKKLFFMTLHSDKPALFSRFITNEQFNHPELASLYNKRYVYFHVKHFAEMMTVLIQEGVMKDGDVEVMGLQYVAPITLLLEACMRDPSQEENALSMIDKHVRQFNRIYCYDKVGKDEK